MYGHIPLLTHERFHSFLSEFRNITLKYVDNDEAGEHLGTLFWFTFEMGIIRKNGEPRPHSGAILTSRSIIDNAKSQHTTKHLFNIRKVLRTPYNHARLQTGYFFLESFYNLFDSLKTLEENLRYAFGLNAEDLQLSTEKQQLSGS
ncbi:hypothetical protein AB9P05_11195 [Roseivirga sp. BDSF3-8]|uniref:hypothetical protein n=1 Tax=Roseivirga sp. BDSF3-8 TaxID=3241598 RepID=UPI00353206FA